MSEATPSTAWEAAFTAFHARFARHFFRAEVRTRSRAYLAALLTPIERKNGWQLAEAMGETDPNGAQRLLYQAVWSDDAVRDDLQAFVIEQFGDPEAILVVDETGFLKKGTHSVGVQRQYSGTAGKVENCQIGVFLTYASPRGHTYLDRRLYLPEAWASDPARRAQAKIPATIEFQTKPALALAMLEQAWRQGVPARWVTADAVYGRDPGLRAALEARGQQYVLAVPTNQPVWATPSPSSSSSSSSSTAPSGSPCATATEVDLPAATTVQALVATWPATAWTRRCIGRGSKGLRTYDWASQRVLDARDGQAGSAVWLLARRSVSDPSQLAYYLASAPADTPEQTLAEVAGARWSVERCLAEGKGETGLDHYEVRHWRSWHRHVTLTLLAHALLASCRADTTLALPTPTAAGEGEKGEPAIARPRPDRVDGPGSATVAGRHAAAAAEFTRVWPGVVNLAAASPSAGPARPLSRLCCHRAPLRFLASSHLRL